MVFDGNLPLGKGGRDTSVVADLVDVERLRDVEDRRLARFTGEVVKMQVLGARNRISSAVF